MASEEGFYCSICLEVFTDPVSTPCGHNYCKSCIVDYWTISEAIQCPLCQEVFGSAPQLRVNTEFRDILEMFRRTGESVPSAGPDASGGVPCDFCQKGACRAAKSCLVCLASYCHAHLQPHRSVQALRWHQLVDPLESLEDRVCKNHNRVKELFCKTDRSCVCALCMKDDHAAHRAVSLEAEATERRAELRRTQRDVKRTLNKKNAESQEIQNSTKQSRLAVENAKAEILKSCAALTALIQSRKAELLELLEERQTAVEQRAQEALGRLQKEIQDQEDVNDKLEELQKLADDFRLLQGLPSGPAPSESQHTTATATATTNAKTFLRVDAVRNAMAKVTEALTEQMDVLVTDVTTDEDHEEAEFDDELGTIQRSFAEQVTLDQDTAHPSLVVSADRKSVKDSVSRRSVPAHPSRFDCLHYVLAREGFSCGKVYFQVSLGGQMSWEVGVARESISKKGVSLSLSPDKGCWTLGLYWGRCQANENPPVPVVPPAASQTVGVFVDYEGRAVSFYDVDRRTLLYSFTNCVFTPAEDEVPSPAAWWGRRVFYTGSRSKEKIHPIFRPGPGPSPLQITAVGRSKAKV